MSSRWGVRMLGVFVVLMLMMMLMQLQKALERMVHTRSAGAAMSR